MTSNIDEIVLCLALHLIIYSNKAELDKICEGLKLGGLFWTEDEANSLKRLFVPTSGTLTARAVHMLFSPILSAPGSNRSDVEEEMLLHWNYFLSDVEEGTVTVDSEAQVALSLEDIPAFATGATSFPILVFERQGTITFLHNGWMLPTASTCALQVCLPIHTGIMRCLKPKWHLAFLMLMASLEMCSTCYQNMFVLQLYNNYIPCLLLLTLGIYHLLYYIILFAI